MKHFLPIMIWFFLGSLVGCIPDAAAVEPASKDEAVPMVTRERACTSPIWYTP